MPEVINVFIKNKNPLVIMTKSTLILRDINLIQELNKVAEVTIMISVSTLHEDKRKLIEPNAAPTIERFKMLSAFAKIGCKTSVLFMPILPYLSDDEANLDEIFKLTKEYNLGSINAWPLHLHGNTKNVFFDFLKQEYPDLLSKYDQLYDVKGNVSPGYLSNFHHKISMLRKKYSLYGEYTPSKPKIKKEIQLSLFSE